MYRNSIPNLRRQLLNLLDATALSAICGALLLYSKYPITLIRTVEIGITAFYQYRVAEVLLTHDNVLEKTVIDSPESDAIACVVGWREREELFNYCLKSLAQSRVVRTVVVGIDGDGKDDLQMQDVFHKVFANSSPAIYFHAPVGDSLLETDTTPYGLNPTRLPNVLATIEDILMRSLHDSDLDLANVRAICVYQPHRCKKEILFTSLLVSIVIAKLTDARYIWSTDSDSVALPGAIDTVMNCLKGSPTAGGMSSRLTAGSPGSETIVSKLIASKYWFDQDVTRSQTAIWGTSECQPGPCAAFRVEALEQVILGWHSQRIFGRRMVTNEDRHMTSTLLHAGWQVYYVPTAIVATEAPRTAMGWFRQQLRWSRGTHAERLAAPVIYAKSHPWFTFHVVKEVVFPFLATVAATHYVCTGENRLHLSTQDFAISIVVEFLFTISTAADRPRIDDLIYLLPAQALYALTKPAIHIWSFVTMFQDSWGDRMPTMRNMRSQLFAWGFAVLWSFMMIAFWTRAGVETVNYYHRDALPVVPLVLLVPVMILGPALAVMIRAENKN